MKTSILILLMATSLTSQTPDFSRSKHCEYLNNAYSLAMLVEFKYNIPIPVTMAVSILESGYGKSYAAQERNNYFGIKKGKKQYISMYESFMDFGLLLATTRRYKSLRYIKKATNYTRCLNEQGFNPHPEYYKKLNTIIKQYDLERY